MDFIAIVFPSMKYSDNNYIILNLTYNDTVEVMIVMIVVVIVKVRGAMVQVVKKFNFEHKQSVVKLRQKH